MQPVTSPNPSAQTVHNSSGEKAATAFNSDFDTFLKMLTAQLKNQDPFNPMKNEEFAVQLATFSSVEQQTKANQLLESIAAGLSGGSLSQVAGWVGMEGRAEMPARFNGSPVTIFPKPHPEADQAVLIVRGADGAEVGRSAIGLSGDPIEWAGVGADGQPLAPGLYSFSVESYKGGESLGQSKAETYSIIREARIEDGQAVLLMDNGEKITSEALTALRKPVS